MNKNNVVAYNEFVGIFKQLKKHPDFRYAEPEEIAPIAASILQASKIGAQTAKIDNQTNTLKEVLKQTEESVLKELLKQIENPTQTY